MSTISNIDVIIQQNLRPCIARGEKGLFHCWETFAEPIAPGLAIGSHPGGQISFVRGIVEMSDGKLIKVFPENIQFVDYAFEHIWEETAIKEVPDANKDR